MQVLSQKPKVEVNEEKYFAPSFMSLNEVGHLMNNTDIDSIESEDYQRLETVNGKQTSTIGE